MENVLINNVSLIEDVTLLESSDINHILKSLNQDTKNCFITKNNDIIKLYMLYIKSNEGKEASAIKVEGVGVRSNLKVIPLALKCINNYIKILDLFTNETSIYFIINKCNNKHIICEVKNVFKEDGFDVN
jgi:aspartokinase